MKKEYKKGGEVGREGKGRKRRRGSGEDMEEKWLIVKKSENRGNEERRMTREKSIERFEMEKGRRMD